MKYKIAVSFLFLFPYFPSCQVNKQVVVKTDCEIICEENIESLYENPQLNLNESVISTHDKRGRTVEAILDCCSSIGLKNIEKLQIEFCKKKFHTLTSKEFINNGGYYHSAFLTARTILGDLASRDAFNISLKYFSVDKTGSDFGIHYLGHFGLSFFNTIIKMMNPIQEKYYNELYDELLIEIVLEEEEENEDYLRVLHSKLYPIIKQDWESGKIKLKSSKPDQMKK